jgi:membrane protein DedA with SNARE-associated domain
MASGALLALVLKYRYWIIFPIACIEGPIFSFLVGTLAGLGYFDVFLVYPIVVAGDLIPDTFLYYLGRYGKRAALIAKYGGMIGVTEGHFEVIERVWHTHPRKTMLMAKLALGLSTPFLVSAGLAGIPVRVFYSVAVPVALLQHVVLLTLGYHFGTSYELVERYVGHAEFFIGVVALFGVAYYLFAAYMKRRFLRAEEDGTL